jgi:tripartite ATP-independent transporter DctM subunit
MEWWLVFLIMFGGLFVLLSLRMPVAFAFLLLSIVGAAIYLGGAGGLCQLVYNAIGAVMNFTFLPVPLFILMGEVMFRTRIGPAAISTVDELLGRLPGRLALLSILSGGLIGALSGSALASVALLGKLLGPEMRKRGYSNFMILGSIVSAGGLAMIIPPTAMGVLLASLTHVSVGQFLIACIIPGILLMVLYTTYVIVVCWCRPSLAPPYVVTHKPWFKRVRTIGTNLIPILFIIFLVTVSIFLGLCTPSEAAALGLGGTLLLAAIYRQLNWDVLRESVNGTLQSTVMIFMILIGSSTFSQILGFTGAAAAITEVALGLPLSPIQLVIVTQLVVLVLGCVMDQVSILMITLPIFLPIIDKIGFNLPLFSIMLLINVEMAGETPPFGMSLFVMKGVSPPDVRTGDLYKSVCSFLVCDVLLMALLFVFPELALWLPGKM